MKHGPIKQAEALEQQLLFVQQRLGAESAEQKEIEKILRSLRESIGQVVAKAEAAFTERKTIPESEVQRVIKGARTRSKRSRTIARTAGFILPTVDAETQRVMLEVWPQIEGGCRGAVMQLLVHAYIAQPNGSDVVTPEAMQAALSTTRKKAMSYVFEVRYKARSPYAIEPVHPEGNRRDVIGYRIRKNSET